MTTPASPPSVPDRDATPAEIFAYLDSEEYQAWRRDQRRTFRDPDAHWSLPWKQGAGDLAEDPCGRGPGVGLETTREAL